MNNKEKKTQEITIKESQIIVDNWINKIGGSYFSELTNLGILTEEVGELARIITRKYGDQTAKKNENDLNLADEMADILFVLICLANQTQTDLTTAFKNNIEKKSNRDKNRHKNNSDQS